jgi:SAM-dependent methyltransferase
VLRTDRPLPEAGVSGRGTDGGAAESSGAAGESGAALRRFHLSLWAAGADAAGELWAGTDCAAASPLLDLGCGAGVYARAFLARDPGARALLVDRADVLELAPAVLGPLAARAALVEADLLQGPLPPARTALLANVLHLFGPEDAGRLLARAAAAVGAGGRVVVKDLRLDDDRRGPAAGVLFSLNLAYFTEAGRVHTTGALLRLLAEAGLVLLRERRLVCSPDSLVLEAAVPPLTSLPTSEPTAATVPGPA